MLNKFGLSLLRFDFNSRFMFFFYLEISKNLTLLNENLKLRECVLLYRE